MNAFAPIARLARLVRDRAAGAARRAAAVVLDALAAFGRLSRDRQVRAVLKIGTVVLNVGVVVFVLNGVMFLTTNDLNANRAWVDHTRDVLGEIAGVMSELGDAESAQRAYLLTGRGDFLASYGLAGRAVRVRMGRLAELTADNPAQQARCGALARAVVEKFRFLDELAFDRLVADQYAGGTAAWTVDLDAGRRKFLEIRRILGEMAAEERRLYVRRDARLDAAVSRIYAGLMAILGKDCTLLAVFVMAFYRAWRAGPLLPDRSGLAPWRPDEGTGEVPGPTWEEE